MTHIYPAGRRPRAKAPPPLSRQTMILHAMRDGKHLICAYNAQTGRTRWALYDGEYYVRSCISRSCEALERAGRLRLIGGGIARQAWGLA